MAVTRVDAGPTAQVLLNPLPSAFSPKTGATRHVADHRTTTTSAAPPNQSVNHAGSVPVLVLSVTEVLHLFRRHLALFLENKTISHVKIKTVSTCTCFVLLFAVQFIGL